ncbi:uncharacterized protein Tco025E_02916 [Trypanosoma conorhini]|uniref:Uncharacterized protein n=1 Tax=Trypanosoma conorhini TaxID=83891 RepID=A0A3R7NJL1_9TRYP|nr:uncharacterized protein Tco025E_02916 [Trypanosoma conorhini]RNF23005.1 hypothetical protein Tco025E_02916 [Trypanosoma conorhini]
MLKMPLEEAEEKKEKTQEKYQHRTPNMHEELQELTNCEPLSKLRGSQMDWLLDSTSHYRRSSGTEAASNANVAVHPTSSFRGVEEDVISEGLSRVDSTSTPHGPQQLASTAPCNRGTAGKSVGKDAAAPGADTAAARLPSQDEGDAGALLITVEVSSSSASPERLVSSPSPVLSARARPSLSTLRGPKGRRHARSAAKREGRRRSSNSVSNPSSRSISNLNAATVISLTSKSNSRRSSALAQHGSAAVPAGAGRRRVSIKRASTPRPSTTPSALSPRTPVEGKSQGARAKSPSPAIPSRETSVATVAAAKKREGRRQVTSSQRSNSKAYISSTEIVVSSESDTDAAPSASPLLSGGKSHRSFLPHEQKRGSAVDRALASASASTSAVAVLGVYEVAGPGAALPVAEEPKKASQANLSHRAPTTTRSAHLDDKNAELKDTNNSAAAHGAEEVEAKVPSEKVKLVATEEEPKRLVKDEEQKVATPPVETLKRAGGEEKHKASEPKRRVSEGNAQQQTATNTEAEETSTRRRVSTEQPAPVAAPTPRETGSVPVVAPEAPNPAVPDKPQEVDEVVAACHAEVKTCGDTAAVPSLQLPLGSKEKSKAKCCSVM